MRKNVWFLLTLAAMVSPVVLAVDAHWQVAPDPNRIPGTPELWSKAANWSTGVVPNGTDQVIWMATANTAPCLVESGSYQINQLKLGEGSDGSNNGHLIVKGIITTADNWSGVGAWGGNTGTLEVDGGRFNTTGGGHMWCGNQGNGTLIMRNGGQINIGVGGGAQLGLGWDGTTGVGRAFIYDGLLTVNNWTTGSIHPSTPSFIDIHTGTLSIAGYRFSPSFNNVTAVDLCAQDGRIRGFGDAKFTKKLNVDNPGNNNENDIINNVLLTWDGSRTIVTAVHPQQPVPYLNDTVIYGDIEFSWNNWDPNRPGDSVFVDVWFGTDPNKLGANYTKKVVAMNVTGQSRSSAVISVPAPGTYYWQVDTTNGVGSFHEGDVFSFVAEAYKAPILTARSVITTMELLPAVIPAAITNNSQAITSVNYVLLSDDLEFPAGANAVLTNTTTNNQNPTASLATDMAGTYKVKLTVSDGITTLEKIIEVDVYADACQAKKDSPSGWAANYYDRDADCDVDLNDFAVLADAWLNDTSMQVQETRVQTVDAAYLPKSVFDARVEGESVDPDAVSEAPVTDETGVRIVNEGGATGGGKALGWTGTGTWAEFELTIEAGTYDVYLSTAAPDNNCTLSFGDAATPNLYGSIGPIAGSGWGNYNISVHPGVLVFDTTGTYTLRITWTNQANLDWFTLVKQ